MVKEKNRLESDRRVFSLGRRTHQHLHDLPQVVRILSRDAGLVVMNHFLVVFGELSRGGAVLEQQAIGIAEVNRAAPFMVDDRGHIDAAFESYTGAAITAVTVACNSAAGISPQSWPGARN